MPSRAPHGEADAQVAVAARAPEGNLFVHLAQGQQYLVFPLVGVGAHHLPCGHARQRAALEAAYDLPAASVAGGLHHDGVARCGLLRAVGHVGPEPQPVSPGPHPGPVHPEEVVAAHHRDRRVWVAVEGLFLVAQGQPALACGDGEGRGHVAGHHAVGGQLRREVVVERRRGVGRPVEREVAQGVVPHHRRAVKVLRASGVGAYAPCECVLSHCDAAEERGSRQQTKVFTAHDIYKDCFRVC